MMSFDGERDVSQCPVIQHVLQCGIDKNCRMLSVQWRNAVDQATSVASCSGTASGAADAETKACSRSAIRSPASSMPTEIRTRSQGSSRSSPTSGGTLACDMQPGRLMVELMLPKLTQMLNICVASTILRDSSSDPVVKLSTAAAPRACLRCSK